MRDNSTQGFIDKDIIELLKKINNHKEYKTTSSCSGRIVLLSSKKKKGDSKWIFKSHEKVSFNEIWKAFQNTKGNVWFLQEPLIVHVKCSNFETCKNLLGICNKAGLKHSGMISTKNFTVEIRGNERIETVINKELISKPYYLMLTKEANKSLGRTKLKIRKLMKEF